MQDLEGLIARLYIELRRWIASKVQDAAAVEDLTQETFASYLKAVERGKSIEDPAAFLQGTAKVLVLEFFRKEGRHRRFLDELLADRRRSPPYDLPADDTASLLEELIEELPPLERALVIGRHRDGLTLRELSSQLSIPVATLHHRYGQALEQLRRQARIKGLEP